MLGIKRMTRVSKRTVIPNADDAFSTIKEAKRQFAASITHDKAGIDPSLRSTVFQLVLEHGGKDEYDAIKKASAQRSMRSIEEHLIKIEGGFSFHRESLRYFSL